MRSSADGTIPSSGNNVFLHSFLERLGEIDEPPTAGEADMAGPWRLGEIPGELAWGLFLPGARQPYARFRHRSTALLAAAVLPGTGRDSSFRLDKEAGPSGFAIRGGEILGAVQVFDENLITALHVVESLVRSPESLATLLEAAGAVALERAGGVLAERFPSEASR